MSTDLDQLYEKLEEPARTCLLDVRELVLAHDPLIT